MGLTHPHDGGLTSATRVVSCATGLLLIGAGVVHVSAAADHTNLPVMMVGFLIVAYLQVGLGGLLILRRPGTLLIAAGVAMTAGSVGLWLLSRTVGLQFLGGEHMEPIGFKDGVCVLFEIATLPALVLLGSRDLLRLTLPGPRLGSHALGLLGTGMFALFVPALMLGGGHHHSHEEMEALAHDHGKPGHQHGSELASAGEAAHTHGQQGHAHGAGGLVPAAGHQHGASLGTAAGAAHQHGGAALPVAHQHAGGDHAPGAPGHSHGKQHSGHSPGGGHVHSRGQGGSGGGHSHGGQGDPAAAHQHPEAGAAGHDHGSNPDKWSGTWEPGTPAAGGKPARGSAMVFRSPPDEQTNGPGHHDSGACNPTAEQRAAADTLYKRTKAVLGKYRNNPLQAYADGFIYQFGPTDRMIHMVNPVRLRDSTIVDPDQIESFIYVMTDTGYEPVGGMYIMPEYGMKGPQPGGCMTQWHHHGGLVGLAASAGTMNRTPEMLHVWTYPGLDPWAHYDGREMSQLWKPGSAVPSVCRESGDAMDGCLP